MDHVVPTVPEHYLPVTVYYVVGEFVTNEPVLSIRCVNGEIIKGKLVIINAQLCISDDSGKLHIPLTSYRVMPN